MEELHAEPAHPIRRALKMCVAFGHGLLLTAVVILEGRTLVDRAQPREWTLIAMPAGR